MNYEFSSLADGNRCLCECWALFPLILSNGYFPSLMYMLSLVGTLLNTRGRPCSDIWGSLQLCPLRYSVLQTLAALVFPSPQLCLLNSGVHWVLPGLSLSVQPGQSFKVVGEVTYGSPCLFSIPQNHFLFFNLFYFSNTVEIQYYITFKYTT